MMKSLQIELFFVLNFDLVSSNHQSKLKLNILDDDFNILEEFKNITFSAAETAEVFLNKIFVLLLLNLTGPVLTGAGVERGLTLMS